MNASPPPSAALPDRLDRRIAALLGVLLCAALGFVSFGHVESLDAEMDFQTVRGVVVHRDGAIHDDNPAGAEILARRASGNFGRSGKFYSWHGPGRALVGVPFYLAGKIGEALWPELEREYAASDSSRWVTDAAPRELFPRLAFTLSSACFGALAAVCVFLSARVLGASRGAALAAALALVLCTWFGPATRSALNALQTAGLLALGAYGLLRYVQSGSQGPARALSLPGLFVLGLVLGLCVWTRPTEAFAVLALSSLALLAAYRRRASGRPLRELVCFAAGALLIAAAMLFWNWHRFGDVRQFGHGEAIEHENFLIVDPLLLALNELFLWISPGKGALLFAPPLLLLPLWWRPRGQRLERTLLLFAAALFFAWPIFSSGWHGGPFYGPRYLTPALPLLAMALARPAGEAWLRGGARKALISCVLALGCAVQLPAWLVSYRTAHELASAVAQREVPMPASYVELYAAGQGVDAASFAALDPVLRAEAWRRAEHAFDNEQRQYFAQLHPAFFPPRLFAQIAWHRAVKPMPLERERLHYAWIASPLEAPLALEAEERARWTPAATLAPDELSLLPSGLEMRGFANLWPIAFATRFAWFPLGLVSGIAAALVVTAALGLAWALRRSAPERRRVE
ncbi:MAG: hypothetical protein IPN34_08845 [Planctomycetes bacterium]|nr:hypothetical protein [Planctomycetota bacterium]